jgi:hypothetical protein
MLFPGRFFLCSPYLLRGQRYRGTSFSLGSQFLFQPLRLIPATFPATGPSLVSRPLFPEQN